MLDKTFLKRSGNPDIYSVKEDDQQLVDAIQKAKNTFKYFKESLISPKSDQTYFSIKTKLTDGAYIEHIWLDAVEIEGNIVYGVVNNVPANLKNIELEKRIGVLIDEVTDWLIIENNKLIGGYTVRAIRDKMSRPHRELFESTINFIIDDGKDFFEHNNLTPEGAILLIEDAYDAKDAEKVFSLIDFDANAQILIKEGPYAKFNTPEIHSQFVEMLKLSLQKSLLERWPSFKGVDRAFIRRQYLPDDLLIITENIYFESKLLFSNKHYVKKQENGTYKVCGTAK